MTSDEILKGMYELAGYLGGRHGKRVGVGEPWEKLVDLANALEEHFILHGKGDGPKPEGVIDARHG